MSGVVNRHPELVSGSTFEQNSSRRNFPPRWMLKRVQHDGLMLLPLLLISAAPSPQPPQQAPASTTNTPRGYKDVYADKRRLLIIAGTIGVLVNGWIFGDATAEPTALRTLVYGPFAAMIVAGALLFEKSGVVWNSRTLLLLGAASYSIYLVHSLMLQYAALAWRELFGAAPIAMPFVAAAGMAIAALVGVALYFVLERPIHRGLKMRLARRSAIADAA